MMIGLLDQLQILTVASDRIARAFISSGATYTRFLTGFGMLVFFTNLTLIESRVRYLALFCLFSVTGGFERGFGRDVFTKISS